VATEVGSAYVTLVPSAKGFAAKMQSELGGDLASAGTAAGGTYSDSLQKTTSSRLKSGASKMFGVLKVAGPLAAAAGVAAAGKLIGDSIGEAREAQVVQARTTSVLKSMGKQAGISAKGVSDLAGAISAKAGIDDEEIQSGENLLLTFKNIRNEAGKGNDVFSQTTQLAVDMSKALGSDVKGASIQLGKALNDPTKGITALSRAGVSFTQKQKDTIKSMQESGDLLGAQKIVLKEVKSEFAGAAESMATPADKAKVAWGNFQETIGTALLPVVDKLLTGFTALLPKIIEFGQAIGRYVGPILKKVIGFITDFISSLRGSSDEAQKTRKGFSEAFTDIKAIVTDVVKVLTVLWATFGPTIMKYIVPTLRNVVTVIKAALHVVRGVVDLVLGLLTGDWALAWQGIKEILGGVWTIIKTIIKQALLVIRLLFTLAFKAIKLVVTRALQGIWALIKLYVRLWVSIFKGITGLFRKALGALGSVLASVFRAAFDRAHDAVTTAISNVVAAVKALPGKLRALGGLLRSAGAAIIAAFINGLKGGGSLVSDIAGNIWNALQGMINTAIDHINAALEFSIKVGPKSFTINPPDIGHLASGGRATGATLAVIGEGREPESVLPDSMLRGLLERAHDSGRGGQVGKLTITNWRDGTGYFKLVAGSVVDDQSRFSRDVGVMRHA
jgi:hypothetical protein